MSEEHTHYHGVDKAEEHLSVADAKRILLESIRPTKHEIVTTNQSSGRVLSNDVISPRDLPDRPRSTRDGYALVFGNGSSFKIVGDVRIGVIPTFALKPGEAARVATGSYLPRDANAVLMVEYAKVDGKNLVADHEIKIGENIIKKGEDYARGQLLLEKGARIHPHHVALLSMLGVRKISVYKKPQIAFFSTGDELIDLKKSTRGIFDANRPFIASMVSKLGGVPVDLGIVRDNYKEIKKKIASGLKCDALLISAGSSVGERDFVARAVESQSGVKMLVHGVAMRPSSPTGIATYRGRPFLLLPGFPTSTIVSFLVFGVPAISGVGGSTSVEPPMVKVRLGEDYNGKKGITHYIRVRIKRDNEEYAASIVRPTEAQYSNWLRQANGIVVIGESGSAKQGDLVDAFLIGDL